MLELGLICECGHADDEHDPATGECLIEQCPCCHFDPDSEE